MYTHTESLLLLVHTGLIPRESDNDLRTCTGTALSTFIRLPALIFKEDFGFSGEPAGEYCGWRRNPLEKGFRKQANVPGWIQLGHGGRNLASTPI